MTNLLVIGASRGHAFSLGTLILNISRTSPHTFDQVRVLADDLTEKDKNIISSLIPADFLPYHCPLTPRAIRRSPYLKFFTPYVLAKLETFKYLANFDSATWLDNDIVILKSLDPLLAFGPSGASFIPTKSGLGDQLLFPIRNFDLEQIAPAGGTFSISRDFAGRENFYPTAMRLAEKHSRGLYLPDQAVMGMAFQELNLKWDNLDEQMFAPHPDTAPKNALIHHAFGPKKFWSGLESNVWADNYHSWVNRGGSQISNRAQNNEFFRMGVKLEIRIARMLAKSAQ